jgi:SPOR domain
MILRRARNQRSSEPASGARAGELGTAPEAGEPGTAPQASEPGTATEASEPGTARQAGELGLETGTWGSATGDANGAGDAAAATVAVETLESTVSVEPAERTAAHEPSSTSDPSARVCPHCSSPLAADQEWCLECGTASTHIRTAPDWRIPVAVVGAVIAIAVAGFIVAIVRLSGSPSNVSGTSAPSAAGTSGLVTISEWPPRVAGWTVVLAHSRSEAVAYAKATKLANQGVAAGVLDSAHHPGWAPGGWVVFSGRYGTQEEAKAAALKLASKGHKAAHAKLVDQPRS